MKNSSDNRTHIEVVIMKRITPKPKISEEGNSSAIESQCTISQEKPNSLCGTESSCDQPAMYQCEANENKEERSCCESDANPCCGQDISDPPGVVTRNPFFNFMREFRVCHQGMSIIEQAVQGGEEWNNMSKEAKSKYVLYKPIVAQ